jgi:hypothetical protein
MSIARFLCFMFAIAVGMARVSPAIAEEAVFDNCKIVKVEDRKLFLEKQGQQRSVEVAAEAKITLDGKDIKLGDFKPGTKVKITARKGDGNVTILKVEGTTK